MHQAKTYAATTLATRHQQVLQDAACLKQGTTVSTTMAQLIHLNILKDEELELYGKQSFVSCTQPIDCDDRAKRSNFQPDGLPFDLSWDPAGCSASLGAYDVHGR